MSRRALDAAAVLLLGAALWGAVLWAWAQSDGPYPSAVAEASR